MNLTMHRLVADTFVPMLVSLGGIIEKAAAHADATGQDLITARLAPDMYPLAKQVEISCRFARDAASRLSGGSTIPSGEAKASWSELKAQIEEAIAVVRATPASDFEGADSRDCPHELPNGMVLPMDGTQFMLGFALPNFYFHLVTAYDILRHHGVELGKRDYMGGLASLMRPK